MGIENVIILGAGASKSEGAPLQKELIGAYFDLLNGKGIKYRKAELKKYFGDFWGIGNNPDKNHLPSFEEILGVLDLAHLRRESFRNYGEREIETIREYLIYLIAVVLKERIGNGKGYHKQLIKNLRQEGELEKTAFISLNYDIIIDDAIKNLGQSYEIDYNFPAYGKDKVEKREKPKPVLLLKIHGSLNWLYCPTCGQIELFKGKVADKTFRKDIRCQKCGTPTKYVIVPPTYYKELANPFIQTIYLKADEVIRNAKSVFFCGYSFPDADIHVKYLLKRGELFQGKTPSIFVINGHFKEKREKNEEKARFLRFFRNKENVHYLNMNFEDFARKGIQTIKEP